MDRRFGVGVAMTLIPILLLSCWLLAYEWLGYVRADDATRSFRSLRAALLTMEKVSAERGPTNAALGEDIPIPPARQAALQRFREESDRRIEQLTDALRVAHCAHCARDVDGARRVRADLTAARGNVDRLIALPLPQRGDLAVQDAVNRMIAVIPGLQSIVTARMSDVVHGDPDALNCLILARLAADLREHAGQLGSHFTAALSMRRALTEYERLSIERTRGRIDQLRAMIDLRVAARPGLATAPLTQLKSAYFGDGLRYVETMRTLASRADGVDTSPAQFAERYVPTMRAITDFRDDVLHLAEDDIRQHRQTMLFALIGTAAAEAVLLAALVWMIRWFRMHIVRPFADATRLIDAIARDDLSHPIPTRFLHREIHAMFDAIRVLRANSLERTRLEHERALLIQELATMAETDSLTHLLNRRAFEHRARATCQQTRADTQPIALIMFDVDHFKLINDTCGHAVGDDALRCVGELCRTHVRQSDIVARIGGEEFAIMAQVGTPDEARAGRALACRDRRGGRAHRGRRGLPHDRQFRCRAGVRRRSGRSDFAAQARRCAALPGQAGRAQSRTDRQRCRYAGSCRAPRDGRVTRLARARFGESPVSPAPAYQTRNISYVSQTPI